MENKKSENTVNKFIEKTFRFVNEQTVINGPVVWSSNGRSFEVNDKTALGRLMPRYFNSDKYSSFVRQLNIYNFQIVKKGKKVVFRHPFFIKDKEEMLGKIKNCKTKKNGKDGFGCVLKEIEQFKLSAKLLSDKLKDLEEKREEEEKSYKQSLERKEDSLKKVLGVVLTLAGKSTYETQVEDILNQISDEDDLFKNIQNYQKVNDLIDNIDLKEYHIDKAVDKLDEIVTDKVKVELSFKKSPEKSFNLSFFNPSFANEKFEEEKNDKPSDFFTEVKEKKEGFGSLLKTDYKENPFKEEEDMSFRLMEGVCVDYDFKNVNRVLDFK